MHYQCIDDIALDLCLIYFVFSVSEAYASWVTMSLARLRTIVSTNWLWEQISNASKRNNALRVLDTSFSPKREVNSYEDHYLQYCYVLLLSTVTFYIPYLPYVFVQTGLSKQCRPR